MRDDVSQAVSPPPESSGYVNVGEFDMYYERHGHGAPLVLLHGAVGTIESCFAGLLPALACNFEVVAVELQGHGPVALGVGSETREWQQGQHSHEERPVSRSSQPAADPQPPPTDPTFLAS